MAMPRITGNLSSFGTQNGTQFEPITLLSALAIATIHLNFECYERAQNLPSGSIVASLMRLGCGRWSMGEIAYRFVGPLSCRHRPSDIR